mgnify:FL=1
METDLAQLGDRHERGEISVGRDENYPYEHKLTELARLTGIKQLRVTGASKWAEIPYEINLNISSVSFTGPYGTKVSRKIFRFY